MQGTYLERVGQRLLQALPTICGVLVVAFWLTRAGNPAVEADRLPATQGAVAHQSLPWQFGHYIVNLFQGDLGRSSRTGVPVLESLIKRLPASLELMVCSLLLAVVTAVPLGIWAAMRPVSWLDDSCRWVAMAGMALPTFLTGLLLIYLFDYCLGWSSASGDTGFGVLDGLIAGDIGRCWRAVQQLVLPSVTLGIGVSALLVRMTRDAMGPVQTSEFIRMARARGLSRRQVWWTYAMPNAMVPLLSGGGMVLSFVFGASVLVEHVFAWPGMGAFAVEAVATSDVVAVQGCVLAMTVLCVWFNLSRDLFVMWIDPRTQASLN